MMNNRLNDLLNILGVDLIIKIFAPKKQKLKQRHNTVRVCQNCGHKW